MIDNPHDPFTWDLIDIEPKPKRVSTADTVNLLAWLFIAAAGLYAVIFRNPVLLRLLPIIILIFLVISVVGITRRSRKPTQKESEPSE